MKTTKIVIMVSLVFSMFFGYGFTNNQTAISKEELFDCLNLTRDKIFLKYGQDYEIVRAGAEGVLKGYYYEKLGILFIFEEDGKVGWIDCRGNNISIDGAKAGMNFSQIKEFLGEAPIKKGMLEAYYPIYLLRYTFNNVQITFSSSNPEGDDSWLSIRRISSSS